MNGMKFRPVLAAVIAAAGLSIAACNSSGATVEALPATATLAPIVSLTPRFTATPIPSRTDMPTETLTPSNTFTEAPPTATFTPSPTPPVMGSVYSVNDVNLREGPGVTFPLITALRPGTSIEVVATDTSGAWFNVRMDGGDEGWISATLVRLEPTNTPPPTATPSPDLTSLAQGTALPTSILGGQPVTPTPPRSVVTPSPAGPTETGVRLPNMQAIDQTATALASNALQITPFSSSQPTSGPLGGPTGGPMPGTPTAAVPVGNASSQEGVDVLAYCDNPIFGSPPPADLAVGSTIDVYWSWYATSMALLQDHIEAASYTVLLDGTRLNITFQPAPREQSDGRYYQYYYARSESLARGQHTVQYTVSWDRAISDGEGSYGPGTTRVTDTGTCTFTVR